MRIASYWASMGVRVDKKSVTAVDTTLTRLEKKLRNFGKLTNKHLKIKLDVNVDQQKLNASLGHSLDLASRVVRFEITRFIINDAALMAALIRAMHNLPPLPPGPRPRPPRPNPPGPNPPGPNPRRDLIPAGGAAGIAARAYMPALALAGGGYGASWLNKRNQEVVSAQLMTQAVVQQAGGTKEQGVQSFDWLRGQANRVGFNYLDAAPDFNKLVSGLTGAGMSVDTSQETFKGFAELSRVNKLDKTSQNRLFRALSQVAGKNQLMSEELTGQIAEALPGGVALFAEAYQRQTGGTLKGSDSISALRDAMKDKKVKGNILPVAAQIASEKAASGLGAASKASQAEQARAQNALNDKAILASNAGVEQGFARLFKTFAIVMNESGPMIEKMAQGFNTMSQHASSVLLSVQSITRFFEGRDSMLGDKLFPTEESKDKAFLFLEQFKAMMVEMDKLTSNIYNGWSMLLEKLNSSSILDTFNTSLSIMANTAATFNKLAEGDVSGALDAAGSVGKKYTNILTAPGRSGANALLSTFTDKRIPTPFRDSDSQLDWQTNYRAEQARLAAASKNQYDLPGITQPLNGANSTNLEIKMDVSIQAANPEDFNAQFQDKVKSIFESTLLQYGQKE